MAVRFRDLIMNRFVSTIRIALIAIVLCTTTGSGCQPCARTDTAQRASIKGAVPRAAASTQQDPRACPPAGVSTLLPANDGTGLRKVVLSWNPSVEPSGEPSLIDGYCLYRSKIPNAAKERATCSDCERVNEQPISSTSCTDSAVQDDTTYYYVVTAIRDNLQSSSSNEVQVVIPPKSQPPAASAVPPPPSCRSALIPAEDECRP